MDSVGVHLDQIDLTFRGNDLVQRHDGYVDGLSMNSALDACPSHETSAL